MSYPLKFKRIKKHIQPRIKTKGEFLQVINGQVSTIWGVDAVAMSVMRGASSDNKNRIKNRLKRKSKKQHRRRKI